MWVVHANCNCNQQTNPLDTVVACTTAHKYTINKLGLGVRPEENTFLISREGRGHGYGLFDIEVMC